MKKFRLLLAIFAIFASLSICITAEAGHRVTISWEPSPDTNYVITNYTLYVGPSTRNYNEAINLGLATNTDYLDLIPGGHYCFTISCSGYAKSDGAYGISDYSNEIEFWVPGGTNNAPTMSSMPNQNIVVGRPVEPIHFTIGDAESPPDKLSISLYSSNPSIIPVSNMNLSGTGSDRYLLLAPIPEQLGEVTISVTVFDEHSNGVSTNFKVLVSTTPQPTPPQSMQIRAVFTP